MAEWKKVIVSGSQAELAALTASIAVRVGANQQITTAQATTFLTGSFTGSFKGDGSALTGVAATFPGTAKTDLATTDQIYINDGANKYVTYGNLVTDLAGSGAGTSNLTTTDTGDSLALTSQVTVTGVTASLFGTASWATNATTATNATNVGLTDTTTGVGPYYITFVDAATGNDNVRVDSTGLTYNATTNTITATASYAVQALSSSFASTVPYSGIQGLPAGIVSGSSLSSAAQGEVVLTTNGVPGSTVDLGLQTTDSPQFVGLTLTGDAAVNGGDITTSATTATVFNTNATTVNAFGAATSLTIGATTGTTTLRNDVSILGTLYVQGNVTAISSSNLYVADQFILLASGSANDSDGGIVIDRGAFGGGNIVFGYDSNTAGTGRWGFQSGFTDTGATFNPAPGNGASGSFIAYAFTEASHGATKPITGEFAKEGAIYTNTDGTIWMYA
jgi:hypothetical protein